MPNCKVGIAYTLEINVKDFFHNKFQMVEQVGK